MWLCGELPRGPAVAVVGTRHPTTEALHFAHELSGDLVRAGVAVLSGGAEGIDGAVHRGALDAGGPTVVVAGSCITRPFPEKHEELFHEVVVAGGAYLTHAPHGQAPTQPAFLIRNSYLVALSHVVVVVEAPHRSGARNAARWARRLGRPLFVVPAAPWSPQGAGCIEELRLGARPLTSARDVLRELDRLRQHAIPSLLGESPANSTASGDEHETEQVLQVLDEGEAVLTLERRGALVPGSPAPGGAAK